MGVEVESRPRFFPFVVVARMLGSKIAGMSSTASFTPRLQMLWSESRDIAKMCATSTEQKKSGCPISFALCGIVRRFPGYQSQENPWME